MKAFLLSNLLLLTSNLFAQKSNENHDSLFTLKRANYSLKYPELWSIDTSRMFGPDLILRSPKTDSLDDFSENMNVFIQNLNGQNYNLTRMGKESEAQIINMITDVHVIESRLDSSNSLKYYLLKYKGRQGKFFLTIIQRYYLHNDIGYALTMTIKEGMESEYSMISEKLFNSFGIQ